MGNIAVSQRLKNLLNILRHQGIRTTCAGIYRRMKYSRMQKMFGFDPWNIQPIELRPYAWDTKQFINEVLIPKIPNDPIVVEVGCGLGDIVRNIGCRNKYGVDMDEKVLSAATTMDSITQYDVGRFGEGESLPGYPHNVDILIILNFLPKEWGGYEALLSNHNVRYLITDGLYGSYSTDGIAENLKQYYQRETLIGKYKGTAGTRLVTLLYNED